jgi:hypothetical protein
MDLSEIQALHARYTAQPVIIDIASHTAAMPVLPAPDAGPGARVRALAVARRLRKAGKPALIALAIAALAAGGGMSVARIWRAMHETAVTPSATVASAARPAPGSSPASRDADRRQSRTTTDVERFRYAQASRSDCARQRRRAFARGNQFQSGGRTDRIDC